MNRIDLVRPRRLDPPDHRRPLPLVELCELPHPPLHRGKSADVAHFEQGPFRFPSRDGPQQLPVGILEGQGFVAEA